jgi:PAS domain S-box-containing protein
MASLIHILHLEDDPADARLIQAKIEETDLACRITLVQTRDEFDDALQHNRYDIILGDYRLPTYDGMSALRLSQEKRPEIPFIFVSGTMGEEAVIDGLTQGATDYVLKKNLSRLPSAVKRALQEARNRHEGRQAREALQRSNEMLRAIIETVPAAIIGLDLEGRVASVWNPAAEKMFGWSAQEVMGRALPTVPMDRQEEFKRLRDQIRKGKTLEGVDVRRQRRDGTPIDYSIYASPLHDAEGRIGGIVNVLVDITERKKAAHERLANLKFFESMDRINRAILGADDPEKMMKDLLDEVLSIFDCDRAFLIYPCDPASPTWTVWMERSKPEYPGIRDRQQEMPMDPQVAETLRMLLAADGPVTIGPGTPHALPEAVSQQFGIKSGISMAIFAKKGRPWHFGIHQCAHARIWTAEEMRVFEAIGRRLEDTMTSMSMYRNLQDSEQRYRMVFENSPVSIWEEDFSAVKTLFDDLKKQGVADIETYFDRHPETVPLCAESVKIVDVNRAALALHGAANKEELLAGLVNVFTPESFDRFRRELVSLWNGGTEMTGDSVVKTLAGDCRNVTVYFSVCPGYEETLARVLVSLTDITERKQTEEELTKYREHLKELVNARTAELSVARDRAEAANRAKTAFLANMSHELRTPLNAVIGYAQVLRMRHHADSALCDALGIIKQSGDHLLTLIDDILDISVVDAGRLDLCPTTIHFTTFLEGIANIIRLRAEAKHLDFQVERADTLPRWVAADERRLRQILLNLLGNAVKFTPAGRVVLRLERRDSPATTPSAHPSHQALLRFEVRDTGIGIAQDQIDRIFEPFEQVRPIDDEGGGTGLGLAISRQLVQLMGGELFVESEPGRGSVFWFEAALAVTSPADEVMPPPERVITGYRGPRRRVLIADDIASNRAVLVEMLARVGFETIEAMDGRQAVHLARETRPDLILMDRRMPGLDGFQAALQIRQSAGLEKVIIMAVSANVSEASKAACRQLGLDAFLPKPIHWPRLAALMEKHVKIEWVYAREVQAQRADKSEDLVPPSPQELTILCELARRGNLHAIAERATRLETMDARLRPFAARLRQLAQAFEDRAVLALIEQFIEE